MLFPGAGETGEAGKALGPSVGRAGARSRSDRESIDTALAPPPPEENLVPAATVGVSPENHLDVAYTRLLEFFFPFPQVPNLIHMVKKCKCSFSPILQGFFFPFCPLQIPLIKVFFTEKSNYYINENIFYQKTYSTS